MDQIEKLLGDINEKNAENTQFEKKKHNLEKHVAEQEKRIMKKINILKRHYEEEKTYGRKLQEDISSLQKKCIKNLTNKKKYWIGYVKNNYMCEHFFEIIF